MIKTGAWFGRMGLRLSLAATIILLAMPGAAARPRDGPTHQMPKDLPMQSILYDAEQVASRQVLSLTQLQQVMDNRGIALDDQGLVHVEIVGPEGGAALPAKAVEPFGGRVTNTWGRRTEAWIPVDQLSDFARTLPAGYFMMRAQRGTPDQAVVGEGPAATNSDDYRNNGANCNGLIVAVIDEGFQGLTAARTNGDAPATGVTTQINYTSSGFESGGTHGTGVVEALFDHCTGATWRLYKIDSLTDMGTAVNDAIAQGVDVISHSLSRYNTGWADNTGDACAAANNATSNGILFFTSAGNRAEQHWQGNFNAGSDGDGWHNWTANDETIDIVMPAWDGAGFYLAWDTTGGTYDYDLYLYNDTLTTVLASSTNGGNNYEEFVWQNSTSSPQTVHLTVFRDSGGTTALEVFVHGGGTFQHAMAANSTTSPSNCTNAISVGAVDHGDFGSAPGTTGIIEDYSSQGPSNSGMTLPDLVGPTNTTGFTYSGGFGGTSCATPNAAGTAATFWSSAPALNATGVNHLIARQARIFRDWGTTGRDNIYGDGGVQLHTFHANTVWVDRSAGNTSGSATLPYYYLSHAQSVAASGGRAVFLGGSYPEPITLNKNLLYETIGSTALLGD